MPVFLPGSSDSNKGHLEKSTEQHKKSQVVKRQASPLHQRVTVRRQKRGGVRAQHTSSAPICAKKLSAPCSTVLQPLEDLGNTLVSIFPVEMQYNIRGTCR